MTKPIYRHRGLSIWGETMEKAYVLTPLPPPRTSIFGHVGRFRGQFGPYFIPHHDLINPLFLQKKWMISITFSSRDTQTKIYSKFLPKCIIQQFLSILYHFSILFYSQIFLTPHFYKTLDLIRPQHIIWGMETLWVVHMFYPQSFPPLHMLGPCVLAGLLSHQAQGRVFREDYLWLGAIGGWLTKSTSHHASYAQHLVWLGNAWVAIRDGPLLIWGDWDMVTFQQKKTKKSCIKNEEISQQKKKRKTWLAFKNDKICIPFHDLNKK